MGVNRLQEVDATRFVANYLVVLIHCACVFQWVACSNAEYAFWNFCSQILAPIALPTLFFVSGYLLFLSHETYLWKIRKRIGRLVMPYICWNLIFIVGYFVVCFAGIREFREFKDGINVWTLLCWTFRKVLSFVEAPADMPTWYLRAIFVYAIFAHVYGFILKGVYWKCRLLLILAALILINYLVVTYSGLAGYLTYTYPIYSLVCFAFGASFSINKVSMSILWGAKWSLFTFVGVMCLVCSLLVCIPESLAPLLKMGQVLIILSCANKLTAIYNYMPKVLRDSSFFVYLSHIAILPLVGKFFSRVFHEMPLACTVTILVSFVVSIFICICLFTVLQKKTPNLLNVLNGRVRI